VDRALIALAVLALVAGGALLYRRWLAAHVLPRHVDPADAGLAGRGGVAAIAFTTTYCLPCQQWEAALGEAGVELTKLDVSKHPELARRYGVRAVPVILALDLPGGRVLFGSLDEPAPADVERVVTLVRAARVPA